MWEGVIPQNGRVYEVQIYTGKHGGAERVLFFSGPALFESPRGGRICCLCIVRRRRKGMPQAVKSIRLRNRDCGLIMQKRNRIAVECKNWTISTNFFA